MKHYFLMVFLQTLSFYVIGQKGNNNLEVLPYVRFDHYPEFSYVLNGRPSTDYINIKGTSFGWDLTYKVPLLANFFLRPGLGFYKYSFNDIDRKNTSFGNSESRNINFVSPLLIPYFTDKYWYNSIALNLGIENDFPIFSRLPGSFSNRY